MDDYQIRIAEADQKKEEEAKKKLEDLEKEWPLKKRVKDLERSKRLDKFFKDREFWKQMAEDARDISNTLGSVVSQSFISTEPVPLASLSVDTTPVEWIWEGFLARGHLTLLSALWKSGKTTFLTGLLAHLQSSKDYCSKPTFNCKVLVISEESNHIWARRRDDASLQSEVWIHSRPVKSRLTYGEWKQFLDKELTFCKKENIDLIIVDTLSAFWPVQNENDASNVHSALLPINALTESNIGVLLVHHHRKGGGDQGQAARGSGVLGSAVDVMVDFERMNGEATTTQRKLTTYSRFEETPKQIVLDFIDNTYITLGTPAEVNKTEKLNKILTIFDDYPNGVTIQGIFDNWDSELLGPRPNKRTLQRYVSELVEKFQLRTKGYAETKGGKAPLYEKFATIEVHDKDQLNSVNNAQSSRHDTPKSIEESQSKTIEETIKEANLLEEAQNDPTPF